LDASFTIVCETCWEVVLIDHICKEIEMGWNKARESFIQDIKVCPRCGAVYNTKNGHKCPKAGDSNAEV
jgi:hypothetical protein